MNSAANTTRNWMRDTLTRVDSPMTPADVWWHVSERLADEAKEKNWSDAELILALGLDKRDLIKTCEELGIPLPRD